MATAKFPKTLGACVDLAYEAREARFALQRKLEAEIKKLKEREDAINEHIVNEFTTEDIDGCKGKVAQCSVSTSFVPTLDDESGGFLAAWKWAKKNDAPEIFIKRINEQAWREQYENGVIIPGTKPFGKKKLSLTKISK